MQERSSHYNDNQRNLVIEDLRDNIRKTIEKAVSIASLCGYWDILGLCILLKQNKVNMFLHKDSFSQGQLMILHLNDEAIKYAISLVAKHGQWRNAVSFTPFRFDIIIRLMKYVRHINALFDMEPALAIADVNVKNESKHKYSIDQSSGLGSAARSLYFNYGIRIESYAKSGKENAISAEALIEKLRQKYADISDLFEGESGISLETYCAGLLTLHNTLVERMKQAEAELLSESGCINLDNNRDFSLLTSTMIFTDTELYTVFGSDFVDYLKNNSFDAEKFNDDELRFHYITRRPFLMGNGFMLFSPELVFDSIMDNTHYTLLESEVAKATYKARNSVQFIDDVVASAASAGYQEKGRDVWLKEGRKDLGDIDLVLQHPQTGHTLLIECKNHTLPLAVYFRSPDAIDKHINSTSDWEKKVQRRIKHVESIDSGYVVDGEWDYVIVTHMPEPLSHISSLLVMTIRELKQWLAISPRVSRFSDLYQQLYDENSISFSESEINEFMKGGFTVMRADE